MKKYIFSLTGGLLFLFSTSMSAQHWVEMMNDSKYNIHDVQSAFYAWYNRQPGGKERLKDFREIKRAVNENEEDDALTQFKRWEYFFEKRTYPTGNRPDPALLEKQYADFKANYNAERLKSAHRIMTGANWTYIGNTSVPSGGGGDGRVAHIRFDPNNSSIVYACTPSGGLWKSLNGGTTWSTNTDGLIDLAVNDIAINPFNTKIMYMATGDGDMAYTGYTPTTVGVLKSTDGGNTWSPSGLYYSLSSTGPSTSTFNELLLNPVDTNVIFCATTSGLYLSTNSGYYWTNVLPNVQVYDVQYEPGNYKVVYASTMYGQFYRSSNSGASFTQIIKGLGDTAFGRMEIGVSPANKAYVYVLASDSATSGFKGLYLSTDTGKTFKRKSNSPNILTWDTYGNTPGGQAWYDLTMAVSPTDANTLFTGGINIWESTDAGSTWKNVTDYTGNNGPYVHADVHHITYVPGSSSSLYAATDGGVSVTTDTGKTWNDISHNLEIGQQYGVGPSSLTSNLWLTGWQDNGTNILSGSAWSVAFGGDGGPCFIDYTNDSNLYASFTGGSLLVSTNGGGHWTSVGYGIALTEYRPWLTPWIENPVRPNTVYVGCSNVWKSVDMADTFKQISTWAKPNSQMTAIAVAPSDTNYIYATQDNVVYYTSNGGVTWKNITGSLPVGSGGIYGIAVSPIKPTRVWVAFSGYSANAKVYESSNAGATWTSLSSGLPNLPVNCIVYQSGTADGIYIGMDQGIYYRDTIINGWVDFSNGIPNTVVMDLKISKGSGKLMAATYGRGTWETNTYTSPLSAPVANFSAYPASLCAGDMVQFSDLSSNQPDRWNWTFTGGKPANSTIQNPAVVYSAAGIYPVSLTASNTKGSNSDTITGFITVYASPAVPAITKSHDTIKCTPNNMYSYQWFFNNSMIPGADSSAYIQSPKLPPGTYKVVITNDKGCSNSGSFNTNTGLNTLSTSSSVSVYPNPANGKLNLVCYLPEGDYTLVMDNVIGQTVYKERRHISGAYNAVIDLKGFSPGVYILIIKGENFIAEKKTVIY